MENLIAFSLTVGISISLWLLQHGIKYLRLFRSKAQINAHCLIASSDSVKFLMARCSNIFSSMSF